MGPDTGKTVGLELEADQLFSIKFCFADFILHGHHLVGDAQLVLDMAMITAPIPSSPSITGPRPKPRRSSTLPLLLLVSHFITITPIFVLSSIQGGTQA
jgi:hypothetical protein